MKRWQELEKAVTDLLNIYKIKYIKIDNYRCFKCGQVQNAKAKSWPDFFCFSPFLLAIECKTGKGQVTKEQEITTQQLRRSGVKTIIIRDTVDGLIELLKKKRPHHVELSVLKNIAVVKMMNMEIEKMGAEEFQRKIEYWNGYLAAINEIRGG